jgi:pyruvate dehydrogenase E1 component beta subunit
VQRLCFDDLDGPVLRVTTLDVNMPYNAKLEQECMPQPERVIAAVESLVRRGRA